MNSFCLVGRVCALPEIRDERGWKSASVMVNVERPFANTQGEFESDQIEVQVYRGAAETLQTCARLNQWVCIKGRLQSRPVRKEGRTFLNYSLIAEKIEYLSTAAENAAA